jgi:archaellum component FlaF (FlaF/FlaG flagellin family)
MKKINLIIALLFSAITYSQMINYTSVRLEEGQDKDYLELESFWSKIHEQAIKDGLEMAWMIWEVIPIEGDENAANQPDYLIMNFYKDSVQQNNQVNFYELGRSVYSKCQRKNLIKNGRMAPTELEIHIS